MFCLCIQFTHENTSERTILHLVKKFVWLLALQKRLATPLFLITNSCFLSVRFFFIHNSIPISYNLLSKPRIYIVYKSLSKPNFLCIHHVPVKIHQIRIFRNIPMIRYLQPFYNFRLYFSSCHLGS